MTIRRHPDPRADDLTRRVMANPRTANAFSGYVLEIDGEPVRPRAINYTADDVRSNETYAMGLTLTLPGAWPDSLEGKSARVWLVVRDPESDLEARWIEFDGAMKIPTRTDEGNTEVEAYTPGEHLSRQKTGEEVAWGGISPRSAMHSAVRRAGHRRVDLRRVPLSPLLYREGDEVFSASAARSELLSDIRDQAQCVFFDNPDGTGSGMPVSALSVPTSSSQPDFFYVVGRDIRPNKFKTTPTTDGRYSEVVVTSEKPEGGREVLLSLSVDNKGVFVPGLVEYEIPVTDRSAEALTTALNLASEMVRALEYGAWGFEMETLILDPRHVRGTHGVVEETTEEGAFEVTRRWMVVISGYARNPKDYVPTAMGAAYKIYERAIAVVPPAPLAPSPGVVAA